MEKIINNLKSMSINDPYIELYEFNIDNYPNNNRKNNIMFNEITNTNIHECGLIGTKLILNQKRPDQDSIYSCDVITNKKNQAGGNVPNNLKIDYLYEKYLRLPAKYKLSDKYDDIVKWLYDDLNMIEFNKLLGDVIEQYNHFYLNHNKQIIDVGHYDAIVYKVRVSNNVKIIVLGDIHGSYHTFFRIFIRLIKFGIIDKDTYMINDNYMIVFLGDVLDRELYSVDIFNVILLLIKINNIGDKIKIIYNRGNHETEEIYSNYGFKEEYILKSKNGKNNINGDGNKNYDNVGKLFSLLSSAVIIENNNGYRIWMCHGGFPIKNNGEPLIFNWDSNAFEMIILKDLIYANQIRWNDFGSVTKDNDNRNVYGCKILGYDVVDKFSKSNNISFIIRGHQDNFSNSLIMYKNNINDTKNMNNTILRSIQSHIDALIPLNSKKLHYSSDIIRNDHNNGYIYKNGPIVRIRANSNIGSWFNVFYPVLTISTNTGRKKRLYKDSLIVIRFDLDADKFKLFDKETNLFDNRNDTEKILFNEGMNSNLKGGYNENKSEIYKLKYFKIKCQMKNGKKNY